eukprot:GHVS01040126.1.p1 GENE.GHVS01040126.1~~GHVS01040126.1.p1  ORF type:complete len:230 (+),score=34.14 GHVS01040126.1:278-967(+)
MTTGSWIHQAPALGSTADHKRNTRRKCLSLGRRYLIVLSLLVLLPWFVFVIYYFKNTPIAPSVPTNLSSTSHHPAGVQVDQADRKPEEIVTGGDPEGGTEKGTGGSGGGRRAPLLAGGEVYLNRLASKQKGLRQAEEKDEASGALKQHQGAVVAERPKQKDGLDGRKGEEKEKEGVASSHLPSDSRSIIDAPRDNTTARASNSYRDRFGQLLKFRLQKQPQPLSDSNGP